MAYIVETIDKFFQYEKNDCPDAKNENDKTRKLFSFQWIGSYFCNCWHTNIAYYMTETYNSKRTVKTNLKTTLFQYVIVIFT